MGAGSRKMSQNFLKLFERQNMQNETISKLYADDKKIKYCNNPNYILKSVKNF